MEDHLGKTPFFAGDAPSLADVALIAYTRLAPEGGFDLTPYQNVLAWIARTQAALRIT
jgi:glutathione S-transferase